MEAMRNPEEAASVTPVQQTLEGINAILLQALRCAIPEM